MDSNRPDNLTLLYPKLADRIMSARGYGYSDGEIKDHLFKIENKALEYYEPEEISLYLGRTPEGMQTVWDDVYRTKALAYEKAYGGMIDRKTIEAGLDAARYYNIPASTAIENSELRDRYKGDMEEMEKAEEEAKSASEALGVSPEQAAALGGRFAEAEAWRDERLRMARKNPLISADRVEEEYQDTLGRIKKTYLDNKRLLIERIDHDNKRPLTPHDISGLPPATVWKGLRKGTADTLGRKAGVTAMNTAEIEHVRDNTALEDIWGNNSLTTAEKAVLMRAAQGNGATLDSMLRGRAGMERVLRGAAGSVDPGEYAQRETALGRFGQAIVENAPYTLLSLAENAPLALLGPMGGIAGGALSAANEAQIERADVYNELIKRGLSHEEAYRQSDPVNWKNMAALSASNTAQNLLTFAGNRIMPGAGRLARIAVPLAGNALMEGGEEGAQRLISDKALGEKTDLKELLYEMALGGASGLMFGGGGMLAGNMLESRERKLRAQKIKEVFQNLFEQTKAWEVESASEPESGVATTQTQGQYSVGQDLFLGKGSETRRRYRVIGFEDGVPVVQPVAPVSGKVGGKARLLSEFDMDGAEDEIADLAAPPEGASPSTLKTESGRSFEDADNSELLIREDGSPELGRIYDDAAAQAGITPGEIHANVGMIRHADMGADGKRGHGEQIRKAGYNDTLSMVADVLENYSNIYEGSDNSILLAKPTANKKAVVAIELSKDEDGIYQAKTAWIARDSWLNKKRLLFARSEPLAADSNPGVTLHGEAVENLEASPTNARQKSNLNEDIVSQEDMNIYNLTSDSKRGFEPEMPPAREPGGEPVTLGEIRAKVEKLLPVRHKKLKRRSAVGQFNAFSDVIRLRYRNDIPALMHEVGHFLDGELGLGASLSPETIKELIDNVPDYFRKAYKQEQLAPEAIAQFFLRYAIDPEKAKILYPEFYKIFDDALKGKPELRPDVEAIAERVNAYFSQPPEERLSSNIVSALSKTPEALRDRARRFGHSFYTKFVDKLHPLQMVSEGVRRKLGLEYLPDELNLHAQAATQPGYKGKADRDAGEFLGVLRGMKPEDREPLSRYLAAARALNYYAKDMFPGLGASRAEHVYFFNNTPDGIKDAAMRLKDIYREVVLRTLVKTGIMSQEQFDYLEMEWPDYVPFIRVDTQDMLEGDIHNFVSGNWHKLVNLSSPIKKATGVASEEEVIPIVDPLEAMLNNIYIFHGLAARNEVGKTMVNISKIEGLGRFAEPVDSPGGSDDYVFYVWEDGKKQYFATDPDVYGALMGAMRISPEALNGVWKTAAAVTDVFRATVTRYSVPFVLRNLTKDAQEVAVNSELRNAWTLPFMHTVKGLITQLNPKLRDALNEAIDEGVMYSAITQIRANSLKGAAKEIRRAFRDGRLSEKSMDAVYKIVEYLGSLNEAIEVAPKITEYIALRQNGVPKKEAAMRARQVNIDFSRVGSEIERLNRYVAFLNANIQGLDKNLRTVSARPMESMFKIFFFEVLPAILLWKLAMSGDDDERKEYEQILRESKDLYYYVKVGDTWMKLPKPHGYNLFPALAERMLDAAYKKDPGAFRELDKTFIGELMPPLAPQFIKAPIEAWTNYSFFTGRPVVSDKYADLPPEMQYGPYTSSVAKALGGITGKSPMIIDHLIRGFTGSVGSALAHAPDALEAGNKREARKVSEWPGIRAFTHTPYHNSESVARFYDLARQTDHALTRYRASGGATGISKDVSFAGLFADTGRQLAGMRKTRAEIQQHPSLPRKEKRERMDQIDKQMAELARQVLKLYDGN